MLELDTLFHEYLSRYGEQLEDDALDDMENLLMLEDQVLLDAFSGKSVLDDMRLDALFMQIKAAISESRGKE